MKTSKRRCWAESLGGCDSLSNEHVFSQAAFRTSPKSRIAVRNFAPIPDGSIGPDSPKSKILCQQHNSKLAILDAEIARVTNPILDWHTDLKPRSVKVSGQLFERWLFKAAINFMAAGYADKVRWTVDPEIVRFVFGSTGVSWPLGMHHLRTWRIDFAHPSEHVGACPVYFGKSQEDGGLVGAVVTFHGLSFLVCFDRSFESLLAMTAADFPIRTELLAYRPEFVGLAAESGSKFQLNFDWSHAEVRSSE